MKRCIWILAGLIAMLWPAVSLQAQTTKGAVLLEEKCASCHGNPSSAVPSTDVMSLWKLTAEQVYAAMGKAPHASLSGASDADWREIAFYIGRRRVDAGKIADAKLMVNQCPGNSPIGDLSAKPMWNGWGNGVTNARFQSAKGAGLTAAQVPKLKLKWAFGFPGADEVYGQPTVAAGRVFLGVDTGAVYSINAETGCVYWSFQADAGVRTAISIGPVKGKGPAKYGVYFGDMRANVYMLDAATGKQIWKVKVEDHPVAKITGAPTLYEDRLYVPVSSQEERTAGWSTVYPCCTFRGSVVALDATNGHTIWKTYPVLNAPKPTTKNSNGVQQYGPNGGAVWNSPTIDPKNHAIYIGTGDAYTKPVSHEYRRHHGAGHEDRKNHVVGSGHARTTPGSPAAAEKSNRKIAYRPQRLAPIMILAPRRSCVNLPNGHRMLVAGQKSGMVWGHDPDQAKALWSGRHNWCTSSRWA